MMQMALEEAMEDDFKLNSEADIARAREQLNERLDKISFKSATVARTNVHKKRKMEVLFNFRLNSLMDKRERLEEERAQDQNREKAAFAQANASNSSVQERQKSR